MKKLLAIVLLLPCFSWAQTTGISGTGVDIRAEGENASSSFFTRSFFTVINDFGSDKEITSATATAETYSCLYFERGTSIYDAAFSPMCPEASASVYTELDGEDLYVYINVSYFAESCQLPAGVDCSDYRLTVFGDAEVTVNFTTSTPPEVEPLIIYNNSLAFPGNYLLTGDGQDDYTSVEFGGAIKITTELDAGVGSHWKFMLFAGGSNAAAPGIDLTGYQTLSFSVRSNKPVTLQGAFGTGDDSDIKGFAPIEATTSWQRITVDISGEDLSDINTFMWLYMHKDLNPIDFGGTEVYIDGIVLQP